MTPTSRSTQWVAEEFDRRAATYDDSRMHICRRPARRVHRDHCRDRRVPADAVRRW
jgi:hypothetical protein